MARILIIDDSLASSASLRDILVSIGQDVIGTVVKVEEGVNTFCKHNPDVVMIDISISIQEIKETIRRIYIENPQARIIVITEVGQKLNLLECLKLGIADFIYRPYKKETVLKIIEKVMEE